MIECWRLRWCLLCELLYFLPGRLDVVVFVVVVTFVGEVRSPVAFFLVIAVTVQLPLGAAP